MTGRPAPLESAVAWELRAAWAGLREVALSLPRRRLRCYVVRVAPTDAFAVVWDGRAELHVPLARVRAVRRPHFHEGDGPALQPPPRPGDRELRQMPGQLALFGEQDRPAGWEDPRARRKKSS